MGFDLVARRPKSGGGGGCFSVNFMVMTVLRSAMLAAGVKNELVYKKFLANDGWLVTPAQSKMIAEKLYKWLKGKNLSLDVAENNEKACQLNRAVWQFQYAIGDPEFKHFVNYMRRAKSLPIRVSRKMRKVIRQFARFCDRGCGFRVH